MRVTALILLAAPVAATFATAADAAARPSIPVTVGYHDLDLATAAGRDALYQRIKRAAARSCGWSGISIAMQALDRRCRTDAIAAAQAPMAVAVAAAEQRERVAAGAGAGALRAR